MPTNSNRSRVAEIAAFHVRIPLKRRIRHASHTRGHTDSIIVRCCLGNGIEGWGEGLPRAYVTGETIETAIELLQATDLKQQVAHPIPTTDDAISMCRGLELVSPSAPARDSFGNSVRCALELSILDAAAREEGIPFSQIVGRISEAAGLLQSSDRVRYSAAITSMKPWKQTLMAAAIRIYGFHQTKVKVGVDEFDDAAGLRRIRRMAGRRMDIRIDANEAWNCETLEAKLNRLSQFAISAVEQPVPHEEVDGLSRVRPNLEVPIILDESLCSIADAARSIENGTCDIFNIRLSKCGGLLNSLRLAAMAHEHNLGYQLGCQVGETGILSAAGRHFASTIANIRYLEGSYERHLVKERLTVEDLTFGRGGYAEALTRPGLGVTIDVEALKRVTQSEYHWKID